jgi:hypothetical protein
MFRSLVLAAFSSLALAAPALGAYPGTYAQQGGDGVSALDGSARYVAAKLGADTRVSVIDAHEGTTLRTATVSGAYGIPTFIPAGTGLGMFHDGSAFVLQSFSSSPTTTFQLVRTSDLSIRDTISLQGAFTFDALAPSGSMLYLIQHTSANDFQHYVVRAYDLDRKALLPGRIADKAQKSWVMQGYPATRVETPTGRWVYTLYSNPGGFPFVHALDTVKGVAHCVGFSWQGDQGPLFNYHLALKGNKLLVLRNDRSVYRAIDRTTWAVRRR